MSKLKTVWLVERVSEDALAAALEDLSARQCAIFNIVPAIELAGQADPEYLVVACRTMKVD